MGNLDLEYVYNIEKNRDASSSIRGFLFQDLIAINELLSEDTKCVYVEYIEDVLVEKNDGNLVVIQAKYKDKINKIAIFRDFLYDYILCKNILKEKNVNFIEFQIVKKNKDIDKSELPDKKEIRKNCRGRDDYSDNTLLKRFATFSLNDEKNFDFESFKENVENMVMNSKNIGEEKLKKKKLELCLSMGATKGNVIECNHKSYIISVCNKIEDYRDEIKKKIRNVVLPNYKLDKNNDIYLGLAVLFLQNKYNEIKNEQDSVEEHKEISRNELIEYIKNSIKCTSNISISGCLIDIVIDTWVEVESNVLEYTIIEKDVSNTELDFIKQTFLDKYAELYNQTLEWFKDIGEDVGKQRKLINTLSKEKKEDIDNYCSKDINFRYTLLISSRKEIKTGLLYFWKIIMDITIDNLKDDVKIYDYIYEKEDIFEIKYKNDEGVILASFDKAQYKKDIIYTFKKMCESKPKIWLYSNSYEYRKKRFRYSQDITQIINNEEVITCNKDISAIDQDDAFRIECMECVEIDIDGWCKKDDCEKSIFCNDCKK